MTAFYDTLVIKPQSCPEDCRACEEACAHRGENSLISVIKAVHVAEVGFNDAMVCNQCSQPRCRDVCPTGAISKSENDGVVRIASEKCIGCGLCTLACPYGGIHYDRTAGKSSKCDLCNGEEPKCVAACPYGVLSLAKSYPVYRRLHENLMSRGVSPCIGCPLELAREADFVVESFPPGYLDQLGLGYTAMREANPKLIVTSITPFGQTGPYKDLRASDLELMAMSGVMYLCGDSDRPPVWIGFPQSYLIASADAAVGTLIAHYYRGISGEGQQVDVSVQESLFAILMHAPFFLKWQGNNPKRSGIYRLGVTGAIFLHPMVWKCRDGHVGYMLQGGKQGAHSNRTIAKYIYMEGDLPNIIRELDWDNLDLARTTPEYMAKLWEPFARFFSRYTCQELYGLALKERIQLFPVNTVKEILEDEQLDAHGFWQEQALPELGKTLRFPGSFARLSFPSESPEAGEGARNEEKQRGLPFEGLKVADFSWIATAPWITKWLAEYGAEVTKVESTTQQAMQLMGSYSYVREHHLEKYWRDARILTLWLGGMQLSRFSVCQGYYDLN